MKNAFGPCGLPPMALIMLLATAGFSDAQIVTDGSIGPKVHLSGGNIEIGAGLGTRPQNGANLFHSFEKFSIGSGQTATFTGPDTIRKAPST
jgi:large exoprotein involved in heme utilization and adhesion